MEDIEEMLNPVLEGSTALDGQEINTIPENPTITDNDATSRFSGAAWFSRVINTKCSVLGVGGIGSYVAYLLARINVHQINIIDPDILEGANMSGQLHSFAYLQESKVSAMNKFLNEVCCYYQCFTSKTLVDEHTILQPVTFCGFDNMIARKNAFKAWKEQHDCNSEALFIDGRLAAEEFQVYVIKGGDEHTISQYEVDGLFTDEEADETICSYKQTAFCANMIASIMINCFVNQKYNEAVGMEIRPVPYYTRYSAETMLLHSIV